MTTTAELLRPISQRLKNTPVQDLPRYAAFLASSISQCSSILLQAERQKGEASVIVHKLKTRVSSLLQDRTPEGRFTGVVLAKAIIDAGGHEVLASSSTWTRMLLSCLGRPDPPEVKKLAIVTLSRMFSMTVAHPALVREITSPNLPNFISATLGLIRPIETTRGSSKSMVASPFLDVVLRCWLTLLFDFPATFRPFLRSLRTILLQLLSDHATSRSTQTLGIQLFAALHFCAPRNTAAAEWAESCEQALNALHQTADAIFRSVIEEWKASDHTRAVAIVGKISAEVKTKASDAIGMEKWVGVKAGVSRLIVLLQLLNRLLTSKQSHPVAVPLTSVLEISGRIAAITPPTKGFSMQTNPEVSREERDELWLCLPEIHVAVAIMLRDLIITYGQVLRPISSTLLSQLLEIFEAQTNDQRVRDSIFQALNGVLKKSLFQLSPSNRKTFEDTISKCCFDIKLVFDQTTQADSKTSLQTMSMDGEKHKNSQLNINPLISIQKKPQPNLVSPAWQLLPNVLKHASAYLSTKLRTEVDSCAILVGHQEAMLASVLNPPPLRAGAKPASSILPFLARLQPGESALEALLRPRMPVIRSDNHAVSTFEEHEKVEESNDDEQMNDIKSAEDGGIDLAIEASHEAASKETPSNGTTRSEMVLSPQKRTFEATVSTKDNTGDKDATSVPKRVKTDTLPQNADHNDQYNTQETYESTTNNTGNLNSEGLAMKDPNNNTTSTTISQIKPKSQDPMASISSWQDTKAGPSHWQGSGVGDSSDDDDDEIPTIDATMSDDEDDEDD